VSVRRLDPVQPARFRFSAENLKWAKETIRKYPPGKEASAVIPLLWRAQEQEGWLTRPAMEAVGKMLNMAFIRVYEVATFYTMFHLSPVGRRAHVQVCGTTPCMLRGAEELIAVCKRKIAPHPHELSADGNLSWEEVECLGACVNAPMVQVFKDTYEDLTPERFGRILDELAAGRTPKPGPQIDRHTSAPLGGPTTLTDPALYGGKTAKAKPAKRTAPRKPSAGKAK
jgi:NADH-quinone oxidoreductase subunit E